MQTTLIVVIVVIVVAVVPMCVRRGVHGKTHDVRG